MASRKPVRSALVSPPRGWALILIDQEPLRLRAWAEFHQASKLQDKAARDLHRHERTDAPAYERWLHGAFPILVTTLRELHAQVDALSEEVEATEYMSVVTGRSLKKLWREHKEYIADPEAFERKAAAAEAKAARRQRDLDDDEEPEDESAFRAAYRENLKNTSRIGPEKTPADVEDPYVLRLFDTPKPKAAADLARDLYRRLVQHLHPDRGGEWTPAREQLWHEVQHAWEARDADWLARLEIEWESAHELINKSSSIGRLRRAILELQAARRDTESKLRIYRTTSAWRFTLSEKKRPQLHRYTETEMHEEIDTVRRQIAYLQSTIAAWEAPLPSRPNPSSKRNRKRP